MARLWSLRCLPLGHDGCTEPNGFTAKGRLFVHISVFHRTGANLQSFSHCTLLRCSAETKRSCLLYHRVRNHQPPTMLSFSHICHRHFFIVKAVPDHTAEKDRHCLSEIFAPRVCVAETRPHRSIPSPTQKSHFRTEGLRETSGMQGSHSTWKTWKNHDKPGKTGGF